MAGYIALVVIIVVVIIFFVVFFGVRAHRKKVSTGREDLVGRTAIVEVALDPKGVVSIEGEYWTAIIDKGRVEPEEEVIVTKVEGLKLYVTSKR